MTLCNGNIGAGCGRLRLTLQEYHIPVHKLRSPLDSCCMLAIVAEVLRHGAAGVRRQKLQRRGLRDLVFHSHPQIRTARCGFRNLHVKNRVCWLDSY